jgi:hypothetical protein
MAGEIIPAKSSSFLINSISTGKYSPNKFSSSFKGRTVQHNMYTEIIPVSIEEKVSSSGVFHRDVLNGINKLYPPSELSRRNAASRTDGYWAYISKGEAPPMTLTYGEFDFLFFAELIDRALSYRCEIGGKNGFTFEDMTFTDIGSGTGRLVLGAAALHPHLKLCKGLELLPGIHKVAETTLELCVMGDNQRLLPFSTSSGMEENIPLAPIVFSMGSFDDPYEYIGDSDIVFVFSTCFSPEMMKSLSDAIGRQCKPGTIVITTEYKLEASGRIDPNVNDPYLSHGQYKIDVIETIDGDCWLVGGTSTAHIQRVMESLWDGSGPREKPEELKQRSKSLSFEEFLKSQ